MIVGCYKGYQIKVSHLYKSVFGLKIIKLNDVKIGVLSIVSDFG